MMSSFEAYLPYITFLVSIFLCFSTKRKKTLLFAFFIIILFSGLRYQVGQDFSSYYNAIVSNDEIPGFELIPRLLIYFARWIQYPFVFFFITAFITNILIYKSISRISKDKFLSVICYICLPFLFLDYMCIVRQALAVSIVLYAYSIYILERNSYKFISFVLVASLCHTSALVGLLYLIPLEKMSYRTHLMFFITCLLLGNGFNLFISNLGLESIVKAKYLRYLTSENQSFGNTMKILYFIIVSLNLYMIKSININGNVIVKSLFSFVNLGGSLYFLFSFNNIFASRITSYFFVLLILSFTYYRISNMSIKLFRILVLFAMLVLFYLELNICYNAYLKTGDGNYIPYYTFFF